MDCVVCGSAAVAERPERTARGYRRFRCRDCGKQYNERSSGLLNHTQYPSDVIALVVLWRLRYRLTLRDLAEMFLQRGLVFSHEAVREWEAKLAPVLADELRRRRHGRNGTRGRHWHVDETYLKVRGRWAYLYRAIDRDGNLVDAMLSEHRDMAAEHLDDAHRIVLGDEVVQALGKQGRLPPVLTLDEALHPTLPQQGSSLPD
jgi:putative transposase